MELETNQIDLGWQARENLGDINELAASIANLGQLQPIIVVAKKDGRYELVAGRRRLEACKQLNKSIRAEVVIPSDTSTQMLELAQMQIEENTKRKSLDLLEVGLSLGKLKEEYDTAYAGENRAPPRFSLVAARTMDLSESTVNLYLEVVRLPKSKLDRIRTESDIRKRNRMLRDAIKQIRNNRRVAKEKERIDRFNAQFVRAKDSLAPIRVTPGMALYGENVYDLCLSAPTGPPDWLVGRLGPVMAPGGSVLLLVPENDSQAYWEALVQEGLEFRQWLYVIRTNPDPQVGYTEVVEHILWFVEPGKVPVWNETKAVTNVFKGRYEARFPKWLIANLLKRHSSQETRVLDPFGNLEVGLVCQRQCRACTLMAQSSEHSEILREELGLTRPQ